jgi:acetate kinase
MNPVILVLNAGSSSLKYKLFRGEEELHAGHFANIGSSGAHASESRVHKINRSETHDVKTHSQAVHAALREIARAFPAEKIEFVAHRVVHGGERFTRHTVITADVENGIDALCAVAPLHNPANLAGIRAARSALPNAVHIACFDTAFHHTIPKFAFLYGLPYELYTKYGIRKYGFHGLSHEYCAQRVHELTHSAERIVTCHLGAGSSLAAVHHGKSVDTTMGFSPLDGLLMATRTGELDPDVPLYLMQKEHLSIAQVLDMLNNR